MEVGCGLGEAPATEAVAGVVRGDWDVDTSGSDMLMQSGSLMRSEVSLGGRGSSAGEGVAQLGKGVWWVMVASP